MKSKIFILSLTLVILAGSCIPSLYPLYTRDDLITDDRIAGNWHGEENCLWTVEKLEHHPGASFMDPEWTEVNEESDPENITYRLTVSDFSDGDTAQAEFNLHLLQLDGCMYTDFIPVNYDLHHDFLSWHMIEANNFARISIADNRLELQFFNPDFLRQLIEGDRIRISHVTLGDKILVTAPTRDLQKFVVKFGSEKDALLDPEVFTRI